MALLIYEFVLRRDFFLLEAIEQSVDSQGIAVTSGRCGCEGQSRQTVYGSITASWIARQWRTRFGCDVTNCLSGVSMS